MTPTVTIYHNPHCSKSRETLALLEQRGIEPQIVHYLETPPDTETLTSLLTLLGFHSARQLIRTKEALYDRLELDNPALSEMQLVATLAQNPQLIERPIVVSDGQARLGRPPEDILDII